MRRELAIKVDYLEPQAQERLQQQTANGSGSVGAG
jgi:hypothetical protein